MSAWGWPQWVSVAIYVIAVGGALILHGKPRPKFSQNYDFPSTALSAVFSIWLLWMGGFWS